MFKFIGLMWYRLKGKSKFCYRLSMAHKVLFLGYCIFSKIPNPSMNVGYHDYEQHNPKCRCYQYD